MSFGFESTNVWLDSSFDNRCTGFQRQLSMPAGLPREAINAISMVYLVVSTRRCSRCVAHLPDLFYPVHRRTVRVLVRVCVRLSVCPSDNFSDANADPTSDRPSDGPDFYPTFSRRGYCKNNDHVSPLAGRCHGSKVLWQILGARSWGTEPVVVRCYGQMH
jgi:hypothetical protein